jgi:hypothetical protein
MNRVADGFMRRFTKAQLPNPVSDRGINSRSIFLLTERSPRHQPTENLHPTCNPTRKNQSLSVKVSSSLIMA